MNKINILIWCKGSTIAFDAIGNSKGKIYIYGTGNGCDKLLKLLKKRNISINGIFASDDFSRGQNFCGYDVQPLSQLEDDGSTVVLAFGSNLPEIMMRVENLEKSHRVISPDMALFNDTAFEKEYLLDNFSRVEKAYNLLSDDFSRKTFINITSYKITGNLSFLREIFVERNDYMPLLNLTENEIYCDLGAYNGDTISEFLAMTNGKYEKIYAVEPVKRNFQKCVKLCKNLDNIHLINAAAWSGDSVLEFSGKGGRQGSICENSHNTYNKLPCVSVDGILGGRRCTYIKSDVEGADFQVLEGAKKTISAYAPKIFASLYHHPYDYIEVPLSVHKQ